MAVWNLVKMAMTQKTEKSTAVKPLNSTVEQTVVKFEEPSTSRPVAYSQEQRASNRKRTLSQKREECRKQKEQIAITLGAKPSKRPYVNYKELKVVRQLEKAKERERKTIQRMLTSKKRRKIFKRRRRFYEQ
ncbi:Autophagy-related protein [Trichinella spiralis]|uniref:Autophagy-related protein n=1 Tax=Trichinella spiralis TaxID=6334 RepID=A0ABR3KGC9_TRISP